MHSLSLYDGNVLSIPDIFDRFNAFYVIILMFFKPTVEIAFSPFKEGNISNLAHEWDLLLQVVCSDSSQTSQTLLQTLLVEAV